MKALFKQILLVVFVASWCVAGYAADTPAAKVVVVVNGKTQQFVTSPRLVDVLAPVAFDQPWYWPASKLFRANTSEPELQKQQTLLLLQQLIEKASGSNQVSLQVLASEIAAWQVAQRVSIKIDYERARVQLAFNPRFEAGHYQLLLQPRPNDVLFFGALSRSTNLDHRSATPLQYYLNDLPFSKNADRQNLYIIQPHGQVVRVTWQQLREQHIEVIPGAMVFVPFRTSWFSGDFARLNQQILALAVNRVI